MIMPSIPDTISLALVAIAACVSHILRSDRLPHAWNLFFAGVALLAESGGAFWLIGGVESAGSAREILIGYIGFAALLSGKELFALLGYLQDAPSPLERS
jgi:hypothetical protein